MEVESVRKTENKKITGMIDTGATTSVLGSSFAIYTNKGESVKAEKYDENPIKLQKYKKCLVCKDRKLHTKIVSACNKK
jgi:hypothetical protein